MPSERRLAARLQRGTLTRRLIGGGGRRRAETIAEHLVPMLRGERTVLDIGSGTCHLAELLEEAGLEVTPLDIADFSFVDHIRPVIYDGRRIPFADDAFDVALIGAVLHHVPDPGRLLCEARRVAPRVLVVEDVHRGSLHRFVASLLDSLLSVELEFPRHGYRSEAEWRSLFAAAGLRVVARGRWSSLGGLFRNVGFLLERDRRPAEPLR